MAINEPYESDSIWPKVGFVATAGTAGLGIYKYNTDENFKKSVNTFIGNHITKIERDPKTRVQSDIDATHEAIRRGENKAKVINPILRKQRLTEAANRDFSQHTFSSFNNWSNKLSMKGSEKITDITGNKIVGSIEEKFLSRLGVSKEAVLNKGLEGSNLVLDVLTNSGKERFSLPLFQREGRTWINRGATSTAVGKMQNVPVRTASGKIVNRIVDPNTALLMALDDDRRLDYYIALSKGGKDASTHARDILTKPVEELKQEYQRQSYELKRFLNTYKQMGAEPIAGFNIAEETALKGYEIIMDPVAGHDVGFVNMAGGNLTGFGRRSVTEESLTGVARSYMGVRSGTNKLLFGRYNTSRGVLSAVANNMTYEQAQWLEQIQHNISSNLSQGQTGEGTASYYRGFADMSAPESLKSVKGYRFEADLNNLRYTTANGASKYNLSSRTTPLYGLPTNMAKDEVDLTMMMLSGNAVNLPMQVSPFSSEAIKLDRKIKGIKISKGINIPLDEFVTGTPSTELNNLTSIFNSMASDPNYIIPDGIDFTLSKGDVLGRRRRSQNLRTAEEYALAKSGPEMEVITTKNNMRITSRHLRAMQERNSKRIEGSPLVLYADYIDEQIKGGSLYGSTRGSLATLDRNSIIRSNLDILPEAEMSFDLFKNVIPSFGGGKNIYNKGRGEYNAMLRSWVAGNIHMSSSEMLATGEVKNLFLKYTNIADLYEENEHTSLKELTSAEFLNISKAQKKFGGLTFKRTGDLGEANIALQRLAAITSMAHENAINAGSGGTYTLGSISSKEAEDFITKRFQAMKAVSDFTPDMINGRALNELPASIQRDIAEGKYALNDVINNRLNFFAPYVPHEAADMTLGRGEGIFRIKGMDLSYMYDKPAMLGEMAIGNQVQSIKMTRETEMMMKSLSNKFSSKDIEEFERVTGQKLETLSQEKLQEVLGPYLSTSNGVSQSIKSPEVFFSSIFGKDNPNGFLIPTIGRNGEKSHLYFPSNEWWGGMMALPDGSYVPAKDDAYAFSRGLASAAETNGYISGNMLDEIVSQAGNSFASNMKASSMQIEGRIYDKLIDSQFLIDTRKRLGSMAGAEAKELNYTMGNMLLMSPGEHSSVLARKMESAIALGQDKNLSMMQSLDYLYGENNQISNYIRRTATQNLSPLEIAQGMTQESIASWERIQSSVNGLGNISAEQLAAIKGDIFNNGTPAMLTRYPVIYPQSSLDTVAFATNELDGRNVAAGHVLKAATNADTDGDAMHVYMGVMEDTRKEAQAHIERENRVAYEYMNQVSENKILKGMLGKTEFGAMSEDMAENYNTFISSLELEGVQAAKLTKGVTGIAQVRAWNQQGYYHELLAKNKNLSAEAALEGRTFIDTIITRSGPQSIISAKLSKAVEDKQTREAVSSIMSVYDNIGNISAESIDRSIGALGEVHTLVEQAINEARSPGNEKILTALNKDGLIDDAIALYDMQWNWRKLEDQKRIESIFKRGWISKEGESVESFKSRLAQEQANVEFFTEKASLKEAGLVTAEHYMDFLQEPLRQGKRQISESISSVRNSVKTMLDRSAIKGEEQFDETINRVANGMILEGNKRKAMGLDVLREEYKRSIVSEERRTYPLVDKVINTLKEKMTPRNLAIGAGVALGAFAAMNLFSGDGAPEELNDLPSYNNPTFTNTRYNNLPQRGIIEGGHNANIASGLLTSQGADRGFLMNNINSIVGSRGYNSSTIISDGASPYKQDMYNYGA
jgi:hypothetical protein